MDGFLLINKPKNWTSFDVVAKIRGICSKSLGKKVKVGHCGTLDPLATGLLIITVGNYTKKSQEFMKKDKTYEVKMKLGEVSTTDDSEDEIKKINDKKPSLKKLSNILESFVDEITQIPPAYSAIKINGKRAYKLAREGKEVKIEPRKVKIHTISNIQYNYPEVSFTTIVSSGTYIRSLVRDIGENLDTGAYMTYLRRINIDEYSVNNAIDIENINIKSIQEHLQLTE
jgi:tRNA pseudouridine55 synthase